MVSSWFQRDPIFPSALKGMSTDKISKHATTKDIQKVTNMWIRFKEKVEPL